MTIDTVLERKLIHKAQLALAFWEIQDNPVLLKYRENAVFRVRLPDGKPAALRLHRPNYQSEDALKAELDFSAYLAANGMAVPQPIAARDGSLCVASETEAGRVIQYASLISWMDGRPLGQTGIALDLSREHSVATFERLGRLFAQLHDLADSYALPSGFNRPHWDMAGLVGDAPLWGRFWDCPGLSDTQAGRLTDLRRTLMERVAEANVSSLDYGLIHADGVRENIMMTDRSVGLIDFDDFGFGFRLFDLATALYKNRDEPHYIDLEAALLEGYGRTRGLPADVAGTLDLFTVLRSLTYIGWAATRPEVSAKVPRYADDALSLADRLF